MKTFGQNLKEIRNSKGISQKELAERLKTTQQRVSEWECGKIEPTLLNIVKILRELGITFEELIEGIN